MTPPPPTHETTDLERTTDAFLTASRAMIGISLRSLSASTIDVTLPQHRLMVLLAAHGPQSVGALAARLGTNQSSTTRLIDRLGRLGLVTRQPSSTDGRSVIVVLEPSGRAVLDAVTASRRRELAELLDQMTPTERRASVRGLVAFNRIAGEPDDAAWPG